MKHLLSIFFIAALTTPTMAQNFDEDRMHRDLEVAENALKVIISPSSKDYHRFNFSSKDIEADYIKDYGVIFTVSGSSLAKVKLVEGVKAKGISKDEDVVVAETIENGHQHFIENSKAFLADYAGIIGQLDGNDKISIRKGGSNFPGGHVIIDDAYFVKSGKEPKVQTIMGYNNGSAADNELIIEVGVDKINALRKGNISREQFFEAVQVTENVMSYEKDADLETLSAMFNRLYKKDLSDTYYSERMPKYSKLSNFGVIVKMKFYSSYEDNNVFSMPTIGKKGLTLDQRNQHVMDLLPKFEADFKENLVNYGRTLKNLDSEEMLLFEINMTTCKDCKDFPRYMKFSVKKSTLHKYNRGKISLDEAIKMVNVEKLAK
ncbi:MAG: hypothetical protein P1U56_00770 [Saprospiraceae bacterium]|nr:hypothetical protein [Saprospiraceae bacterium]